MAIFTCEALGPFEAVPLPRVRRSGVVVDDTPHVLEPIALRQEIGMILTVVIDRSPRTFFLFGVDSATGARRIGCGPRRGGAFRPDRSDAPGWGERDYHHRLIESGIDTAPPSSIACSY